VEPDDLNTWTERRTANKQTHDVDPEDVAELREIHQLDLAALNDALGRGLVRLVRRVGDGGRVQPGVKDEVEDVDGEAEAGEAGADDKGSARAISVRERVARDGRKEARAFAGNEAERERDAEAVVREVADDTGGEREEEGRVRRECRGSIAMTRGRAARGAWKRTWSLGRRRAG
jgi:hypothetical protein